MCGVHMSRYQHGRVISRPPRGVGVRGSTRPPDGGIRVRGPVSSAGERHSPTGPGASSYCVCACGLQGLVAFPHPPLNIKNRAWVQHGGPFPGPSRVYALPLPPGPIWRGGRKGNPTANRPRQFGLMSREKGVMCQNVIPGPLTANVPISGAGEWGTPRLSGGDRRASVLIASAGDPQLQVRQGVSAARAYLCGLQGLVAIPHPPLNI